jgi:long-chain acyl-CoA synthetase
LLASSPATFVEYWNDSASTKAAFDGEWLRTGDLGSQDEDGFYCFHGRLKEIIVRGGSNISPQEVEEVLYQHSQVKEVGVVGQLDEVYGEAVTAFVVLRDGIQPDKAELTNFARKSLADYKVPQSFIFLDELPKSPTGKVHRRLLKERLLVKAAGH